MTSGTKYLIVICIFVAGFMRLFSPSSGSSLYANSSSEQTNNFQNDLLDAENYWTHNHLGSEHAINGRYDKAAEEYRKSIAIIEALPGESWADVSQEKMAQINKESRDFKQIFARYGLIEALEKTGQYQEALKNVGWLIQNQRVNGKEELLKQKLDGMKQNILQKMQASQSSHSS